MYISERLHQMHTNANEFHINMYVQYIVQVYIISKSMPVLTN